MKVARLRRPRVINAIVGASITLALIVSILSFSTVYRHSHQDQSSDFIENSPISSLRNHHSQHRELQSFNAEQTSRFKECLESFANRDHAMNDGVSIRFGIFSQWNEVSSRQHIRDTWMRWKPQFNQTINQSDKQSLNVDAYCTRYATSDSSAADLQRDLFTKPAINCRLIQPDLDWTELDGSWLSVYDNIELRFIIGAVSRSLNERMLANLTLSHEQELHGDLQLLDQNENMDEGKSLYWMQSMAREHASRQQALQEKTSATSEAIVSPDEYWFDYVMKVDSDSFVHLPNLVKKLRTFRARRLPEVYYGLYYHIPHAVPPTELASNMTFYHSGMGYVTSMDIVSYFITPEGLDVVKRAVGVGVEGEHVPDAVRGNNTLGHGTEDIMWGTWIGERGRALGRDKDPAWTHGQGTDEAYRLYHALVKNFINAAPNFYYHPRWSHYWALLQYHENTELIHWNKDLNWYKEVVTHLMCGRSQVYDWRGHRAWWSDKQRHPRDISYHFTEEGEVLPTKEWYEDWGQSYRESRLKELGQ